MYFQLKSLCAVLNQYKQIIIYGTGNYAQMIYPKLAGVGLQEKIICFTQTEESACESIYDVPVIPIEKLERDKADCVFLIAVGKLYVNEIRDTLLQYDYLNIVTLIDYLQCVDYLENSLVFEDYCKMIADWYIETHTSIADKEELIKEIADRGRYIGRAKKNNLIVVISGNITPRTIKITGALQRKKYDIIILDYSLNRHTWMLEEIQKSDIKIHKCYCIEELLYNALQYNPLVYFVEPSWGNCSWPQIMFQQKQYFGKVIIALYDVINDGYNGFKTDALAKERYVLEHADGIVWRWFSKEYLERKGFLFQGKSIQFLDYCAHEDGNIQTISCAMDDYVVKLCMVNGDGNEYVAKRTFGSKYSIWARIEEILIKIGNMPNCIFHFYAGSLNDENLAVCRSYEQQYSNFKVFSNTDHYELLRKLKNYDYGCELFTGGEEPPDDVSIEYYKGSFCRNSVRNAFFDFIGAGLPVITTYATKMWEYLSAYDIVIKMNVSNLDIEFLKQNREYYKTEVNRARGDLSIDNQIDRLISFFQEV